MLFRGQAGSGQRWEYVLLAQGLSAGAAPWQRLGEAWRPLARSRLDQQAQESDNPSDMTATLPFETTSTPRVRLEQAQRWLEQVPEVPPSVAIVVRCVLWLNAVDLFRQDEMKQLEAEAHDSILSGHRAALCDLIADGEVIVLFAKRNGWSESFKEFTLADVEATLESLHTTFNCQYSPRLHPSRAAEVSALFEGA